MDQNATGRDDTQAALAAFGLSALALLMGGGLLWVALTLDEKTTMNTWQSMRRPGAAIFLEVASLPIQQLAAGLLGIAVLLCGLLCFGLGVGVLFDRVRNRKQIAGHEAFQRDRQDRRARKQRQKAPAPGTRQRHPDSGAR